MNPVRFWQIDFARGVAVVGMIIYHFLVDLELFYSFPVGVFNLPLVIFARLVASTFILLAGINAAIYYKKHQSVTGLVKRSLVILFFALIITIVTYILFPDNFIFFGILHFIGLSLILLIPFLKINTVWLIIYGLISALLGLLFKPSDFNSLDYFPLFPWFGLILIGLALGRVLPSVLIRTPSPPFAQPLILLGRYSLTIYLLHQPVLLFLLLTFLK